MALFQHHASGRDLMQAYRQKRFDQVMELIKGTLGDFEKEAYARLGKEDQLKLDATVAAILYIFAQEDFQIPNKYLVNSIITNHLLTNLVSMSAYRSTDGVLRHIMHQQNNFGKILTLYSSRNEQLFNQDIFFDLNDKLATLWWFAYGISSCGSPTQLINDNVNRHYVKIPDKFKMSFNGTAPVYFDCSYTLVQQDRPIKEVLNKQCRELLPFYQMEKKPKRENIVIVTGRWYPTSAVYKSSQPYIAALADKYNLTLLHLTKEDDKVDTSLFRRIIFTPNLNKDCSLDLHVLKQLDCQLAYFPDIGMSNESVILSNLQIAPIMVVGYGHPSSTFGSLVDYYIGGSEVELVEKAQENYSEKLVLIPGMGAQSVIPQYERNNKPKEGLIINCAWTSPKINYEMLLNLKQISERTGARIRFFPAWTIGRYCSMIPFITDVSKIMGDECSIIPELPYTDYLIELEKGSIGLDSHPFGGYNTVVDNLFCGCPVVCIEGVRAYSRFASAILRRLGMDWCIVHSQEEYVEKVAELLTNKERLNEMQAKIADVEVLKSKLCTTGEEKGFVTAIDWILENHERIIKNNGMGPFFIER